MRHTSAVLLIACSIIVFSVLIVPLDPAHADDLDPTYQGVLIQKGKNSKKCLIFDFLAMMTVGNCVGPAKSYRSWTITKQGELRQRDECLSTADNGNFKFVKCGTPNARTRWTIKNGQIRQGKMCLTRTSWRQQWVPVLKAVKSRLKKREFKKALKQLKKIKKATRPIRLGPCKAKKRTQEFYIWGKKAGDFRGRGTCELPDDQPLNSVRQVRAHNAYENKHFKFFSDSFKHGVIEIDITPLRHDGRLHLYVSHGEDKHHNNCRRWGKDGKVITDSRGEPVFNNNLYACLQELNRWHKADKQHPFKTVVINVKVLDPRTTALLPGAFASPRAAKGEYVPGNLNPAVYMGRIEEALKNVFDPKTDLYRPVDRRGSYRNMDIALNKTPWPTLGELRGKIAFSLNVGPTLPRKSDGNVVLNNYLELYMYGRSAFVCPHVDRAKDLDFEGKWNDWAGLSKLNRRHVACATLRAETSKKVLKKKAAKARLGRMIVDFWNEANAKSQFLGSPCLSSNDFCQTDPRGFDRIAQMSSNMYPFRNFFLKYGRKYLGKEASSRLFAKRKLPPAPTMIEVNFPVSSGWARPGPRGWDKCPYDWLPAREEARQIGPLEGKRPKLFKRNKKKKKKKSNRGGRSKRRTP